MIVDVKNVVFATMARVVWRGAFILAGILIYRLRSQQDFAVFQFFNITAVSMATYGSLGLGTASTRFFASNTGQVRDERRGHTSMILQVGILLSFLAAVVAFILGDLLLGNASDLRIQFSVLTAVYLYAGVVDGGMVGLGRFKTLFSNSFIGAAILLLCFYMFAGELSLSLIVWLFCLAPLVTLSLNALALLRVARPWQLRFREVVENKKALKEVFDFSLPLFFTGFVAVSVPWIYGRGLQGTPEMVMAFAHFSIGLQWFSLVLLLPSMITRVVAAQVFAEVDDGVASRALLIKRSILNAGVATCAAVALMLLSPIVLRFYGSEATTARLDLGVMSIAAVLASTLGVVGTYVMATIGAWRWLILMVTWGVCAVAVFFGLIKSGVMVVSIGYLVAYVVLCGAAWWTVVATTVYREPLEAKSNDCD